MYIRFLATLISVAIFALPAVASAAGNPGREGAWILEPGAAPTVLMPAAEFSSQLELRKASGATITQAGGDDVYIAEGYPSDRIQVDIASNGDIYLAHQTSNASSLADQWIDVYRSVDGGTSFDFFGIIQSSSGHEELLDLNVVEGNANRVYITYTYGEYFGGVSDLRIAFAELSAPNAVWTMRTIQSDNLPHYVGDMADDSLSFSDYYLYVVYDGFGAGGGDIWYSRSTDYGLTWSSPYRIAEFSSDSGKHYSNPSIAIGQGGLVHVAYQYDDRDSDDPTIDSGVRYLKATNYAAAPADWSISSNLYNPNDGVETFPTDIVASPSSATVALFTANPVDGSNAAVVASYTDGTSWSFANEHALDMMSSPKALFDPINNRVLIAGAGDGASPGAVLVRSAPIGDLGNLSALMDFSSAPGDKRGLALAVDPTRGNQVALSWIGDLSTGPSYEGYYHATFDAEWRGDDGYPNYQPGFPVTTEGDDPLARSRTAPAIADLDGDSFEEIIFANTDGTVHVIQSDGSVRNGWPVDVGEIPLRAPVAVGDLNGDGILEVVAGTIDGMVHAYDPDGALLPGFPVDLLTGDRTYVSMGSAGGPYLRWIYAASGNMMARISYRGEAQFKAGSLSGTYSGPAAIGDVDNDGMSEVVVGYLSSTGDAGVHLYSGDLSCCTTNRWLFGEEISNAVSLADVDLDGDLEIAVPTESGKVYLLQGDMTDYSNFPFDNGGSGEISAVHFSQILGNGEPELLFSSLLGKVHLVPETGVEQSSYPGLTDPSWYVRGAPIATGLSDWPNLLTVGSRDESIYSFRNTDASVGADGWPRNLGDKFEMTPARSDIDNDGRIEVVYLGNDALHVIDVGAKGQFDQHSWTMAGNNAERNSCYECNYDVATDAPEVAASQVSFRMQSQNPAPGPVSFAAGLPAPGVVELAIYDLAGRRVRLVGRRSVNAGEHVFSFDGRDLHGARLAQGAYFARLRVMSEGSTEAQVQRFTILD